VENSFGVMCARFICIARTLYADPDNAQKIVLACVALHNYLLQKTPEVYTPPGFTDSFSEDGELIEGAWRAAITKTQAEDPIPKLTFAAQGRATDLAKRIRNQVCDYVNSDVGSVKWQRKYLF